MVGRGTRLDARGSGGGGEDLIAEVAQGVVAAAGELAGHRQQRELAVEAGFDPLEVGVVPLCQPWVSHRS